MRARILFTGALILLSFLAMPLAAVGLEAAPAAAVSGVDYASGTVTATVRFAAPVARVELLSEGVPGASVECTAGQIEVSVGSYAVTSTLVFVFVGLDASGSRIWECSMTVDPAQYRPRKPVVGVTGSKVVPARFAFKVETGVPITWIKTSAKGDTRSSSATMSTDATGSVRVASPSIPYGRTTLSVTARNGFGSSPKASVVVYNLGTSLPKRSRYVLVCKRTLWLFDVKKGIVIHRWPVGLGTQGTPTPTGSFTLGRARPASGAWGVLRRRLYRDIAGKPNPPTRYYIHGTNAPWSIGMKASHGCVRMYNSHVRQFAKVVPRGTYVRIR